MAQKKVRNDKKGFTRLQSSSKQKSHAVRREFGGLNFFFFRNPETGYGECTVSKNLARDYHYDNAGNETLVQEVGHDEIVNHFKKNEGCKDVTPTKKNKGTTEDSVESN